LSIASGKKQIKTFIAKIGTVRLIALIMVAILVLVFTFRENIKESKYTKAKMEIFDRLLKNEPGQWPADIRHVVDSLILEKEDSLTLQKTDSLPG